MLSPTIFISRRDDQIRAGNGLLAGLVVCAGATVFGMTEAECMPRLKEELTPVKAKAAAIPAHQPVEPTGFRNLKQFREHRERETRANDARVIQDRKDKARAEKFR